MTTPRDSLPKTSPLVQKKRAQTRKGVDTRGMISIATMLASLAAISIAMGGGAKLILDIFGDDENKDLDNLLVKIVVLGFSFVFGWVIGLISIRGFNNMIYPIIVKLYSWGILIATVILYIEIIQRLYKQEYSGQKFGTYLVTLLGVMFALFCLHLLVEGHDLRPFAIPLIITSVIHLFVTVVRFLFTDAKGIYALGDFTVFLLMITISGLMLMHIGIFSPVREQIGEIFEKKPEVEENNGNKNGTGVS